VVGFPWWDGHTVLASEQPDVRSTLANRVYEVVTEPFVARSPQRRLVWYGIETECVDEIRLLVEIPHECGLMRPAMKIHEHKRTHHRHDGLGLGAPHWMGIMRSKIKMMQWAPADERFHSIVVLVFEPRAGEPMDIVFERTEIGGCDSVFGSR
jgi:hypothetical protein